MVEQWCIGLEDIELCRHVKRQQVFPGGCLRQRLLVGESQLSGFFESPVIVIVMKYSNIQRLLVPGYLHLPAEVIKVDFESIKVLVQCP